MNQRMCVVCRTRRSKDELIRISKKDEMPIIDPNKEQTSRAIYVCKNEKCIDLLKKSKATERFLKVMAEDKFFEELKNLI